MLFKKSKPIKRFYDLIRDSNELINKRKFDKALALYPKIKTSYKKITKTEQENLRNLLEDIERKLILLMKFKEIHVLISDKYFSRVPDHFDRISYIIDYLKASEKAPEDLINYSEERLDSYKKWYKEELLRKIKNHKSRIEKIKDTLIKSREKNKTKKLMKKKIVKNKVKTVVESPIQKEEKNVSELLEENKFEEVRKMLKKGF